ncbi:hypothetical protein AHAS_Ahas19G0127500 [Arachis hypogaea]
MIKKRRYHKYNKAEMSKEYEFKVGLEFKSLGQFKDAIRKHALLNGRDIRYIKNDKVRGRVGCRGKKGKCRWMAFASKVGGSDCFRLKTLNRKHTCGRNYNVTKAYWARRKTREVHDRAILQYGKLRDYCAEIMRTNPGCTTQILFDRPSITHQLRFMKMNMCLDSVKQGFLAGCKPIIGVDGYHLKGDHSQQLMVAVGRDPNDNYFPIAVAIVEAETRDSWGWFINLLLDDIGYVSRRKWIFMSDQQKVSTCYVIIY